MVVLNRYSYRNSVHRVTDHSVQHDALPDVSRKFFREPGVHAAVDDAAGFSVDDLQLRLLVLLAIINRHSTQGALYRTIPLLRVELASRSQTVHIRGDDECRRNDGQLASRGLNRDFHDGPSIDADESF